LKTYIPAALIVPFPNNNVSGERFCVMMLGSRKRDNWYRSTDVDETVEESISQDFVEGLPDASLRASHPSAVVFNVSRTADLRVRPARDLDNPLGTKLTP
jgi:hypothetical protein